MNLKPYKQLIFFPKVALILSVVLFLAGILPLTASAKDFFVTFIKETYKEEAVSEESFPKIYHTWYVQTDAGDKLLVLTGEDLMYRKWLREFTQDHDLFLVKIPENQAGAFETSQVFEIDLTKIHPIDREAVNAGKKQKRQRK